MRFFPTWRLEIIIFIFIHFLLAFFLIKSKRKFKATPHRGRETDLLRGIGRQGIMRVNEYSYLIPAAQPKDAAPH
jgi:hypothetical protein